MELICTDLLVGDLLVGDLLVDLLVGKTDYQFLKLVYGTIGKVEDNLHLEK